MSSSGPTTEEETPLLHSQDTGAAKSQKETPLPWAQLSIVLFLQLAEPLTSQVIYPFIPQLIRDVGITHGDDTKVGYYVGMMQSIFFATQAVTVLHWSRVSDHIGRKPVILVGLFGLSLSMCCFGLSRSFWSLVASRSIAGALNGNVGVIKSIMGELTDSTNVARAFAYQPLAWSTGGTIGPLIGGSLSHPADQFPGLFGNSQFLKAYPYFLPCAIPATFSVIVWIVTFFFLKETNPSNFSIRNLFVRKRPRAISTSPQNIADSDPTMATSISSDPTANTRTNEPVSMMSLLTPKVIVAVGNYTLLSLVDTAYRAIQPLFFATPINIGGLGLPPSTIGVCLAAVGLINGIFQVLFFADIHHRIGSRTFYLLGIGSAFPIFALFPIMSVLAKNYGLGWIVWTAIGLQLALSVLLNVCFGCIFIYITAASPNRRSLGATNGLAQMLVSVMRTIGPAVTNSLFSLSLQRGYLGGWLVYYVLISFVCVAVVGGVMFPREVWKRAEED